MRSRHRPAALTPDASNLSGRRESRAVTMDRHRTKTSARSLSRIDPDPSTRCSARTGPPDRRPPMVRRRHRVRRPAPPCSSPRTTDPRAATMPWTRPPRAPCGWAPPRWSSDLIPRRVNRAYSGGGSRAWAMEQFHYSRRVCPWMLLGSGTRTCSTSASPPRCAARSPSMSPCTRYALMASNSKSPARSSRSRTEGPGPSRGVMGDSGRHRFLDAHASSGRLPDALGAGTLDDLARLGIHGGVASAIASKLHDCRRGNRQLLQDLTGRPGWRPCWTLGAEVSGTGAFGQVHEALDAGAAAVTLYPRTQDFSLQGLASTWPVLESERIPVIIDRTEVEWPDLDRLAAAHPRLPIIVSWIGYRELRRLAPLLRDRPNVLLDTVNFSTPCGYDWFVDNFGAERLLFATGVPLRDPGEAITQLLWSGLTQQEVDLISHGNAERLFGFYSEEPQVRRESVEVGTLRSEVLAREPSRRRIVDAHAHAGPYSLFHIPDPDPEDMVTVMDRCGVDLTVISTNRAIQEDSRLGNDETLAAVDAFPDRIRGYGVVNPWQDPEVELERIADDPRFVGIKLHPDLHRYPLTGARYRSV